MSISQRLRLFVSVELPAEVVTEIKRIQKEIKNLDLFEGTFVKPENLHITLAFFGSVQQDEVPFIHQQLSQLTFPSPRIRLLELATNSWRKPHVLWINVDSPSLTQFARSIRALFPKFAEQYAFKGHITIARMKKVTDKERLKAVCLNTAIADYSWNVREFSVWQSQILATGPVYTLLNSYSLQRA